MCVKKILVNKRLLKPIVTTFSKRCLCFFFFIFILFFFLFNIKQIYLYKAHYEQPLYSVKSVKRKKSRNIRNKSACRIAMIMKFSTHSRHCIELLCKPF